MKFIEMLCRRVRYWSTVGDLEPLDRQLLNDIGIRRLDFENIALGRYVREVPLDIIPGGRASPPSSDQVFWIVQLSILRGRLPAFKALSSEMLQSARGERGTLTFERYVSEDGTTAYAYERYATSEAALAHLKTFLRSFAERFGTMVERRQFFVFGNASPELKALLAPFGAHFLSQLED